MALRIIEAHVSPDPRDDAQQVLGEFSQQNWVEDGGRFGSVVSAVLGAELTGPAMDRLHERLGARGPLLVLVQPLDAVLPRPLASPATDARADARSAAAVSREECVRQHRWHCPTQ